MVLLGIRQSIVLKLTNAALPMQDKRTTGTFRLDGMLWSSFLLLQVVFNEIENSKLIM